MARTSACILSASYIRQICRTQHTYEARNDFGQILQRPLQHGAWKEQPNHVRRQDGTLLEYTPPEHVQSQMERLLELYNETTNEHPVVRATWLHHRFIRIHPFEDGNGRVARALTLLVLLRARYAPLVVDRTQRGAYLSRLSIKQMPAICETWSACSLALRLLHCAPS